MLRKRFVVGFLVLMNITASSQTKNPFAILKFDKLIMYDYESNGEKPGDVVSANGQLINSIRKSIPLQKNIVGPLNKKLDQKSSYGGGTASCFEPHLGFVYYLKTKIVAHISICLGCNRLYSSIDIPAQKQGKVGKGKEVYYILDGMSKSFRKYLNGLLTKYNFSHQVKPGDSQFDN